LRKFWGEREKPASKLMKIVDARGRGDAIGSPLQGGRLQNIDRQQFHEDKSSGGQIGGEGKVKN